MRIDIPKNTWLTGASFDFLKEGMSDGMLALSLTFGGAPGDAKQSIELLQKLLAVPMPESNRIVRVSGKYYPNDPQLVFFLGALRKYGYEIHAVVGPEDGVQPWFEYVNWTILRSREPFLAIDANELWYCPSDDAPLSDVLMPPLSHPVFLFLSRTRTVDESMAFFMASKHRWALL
jgi:hypothetical protein